nr:hypothetical protein [Tanacetum cinerariifolium]
MSAVANTTPIVTTVTKTATKEKTLNGAETASRINILDFYEEHYENILPVMDKIRRDKRREVHTRLDFGDNSRKSRRMREDSQKSSAKTLESAFKRLSDTYSPSTTKSKPDREYSKDDSYSSGRSHKRNSSPNRYRPRSRGRSHGVEESMKRGRNSESPLSRVLESGTSEGGHWKSMSKRRKPTDEEDLAVPWSCEAMDPFTPRIRNFKRTARVWFDELPLESIDGYTDLKAAFLAYLMQQKKYVKDPVKIHNIKQKDGETIEEFMKRFKIETGQLIKRLNERVPNTLEEMMTATAAFIRGEIEPAKGWTGVQQVYPLNQNAQRAAESGKFKPLPPRVTSVEKRSSNKFYEFHNDKGHNTDECVQLRKHIEELKVTQSFAHIKEITLPPLTANKGTGGPLVIEAEISGHAVHRIYVDGGSSMDVLYEHCFNRLKPKIKSQMVPATTSLTGFSGETIWPLGQLRFLVTIGDAEHHTKAWMNFMIVRSPSSYNSIIERPGIREIQALPSTAHGMLKFPVNGGIMTIHSTIPTPTECTTITATPKGHVKKAEAHHENFRVAIHPDFSDQEITIRGTEHAKAIQVEVQKLVEAGILREVYYHDWLSNPIMVKKHDGSWRMCVDFTDLNKACSQDCYPLSEIGWKVKSLCGYPFKCFLDAYKGYHQIQMAEQDEKKTAFHTSHGWTPDAEQAFKQLRQHLAKLPMLVVPKPKEELIVYLSASHGAISAVLKTEKDTVQTPILSGTSHRGHHRPAHQASDILANFLVEKPDDSSPKASAIETPQEPWTLFTDGSSCFDGSSAGLILTSPEGTKFTYALRFQFVASNNKAEYESLIAGLRIATQMGMCNVYVSVDSKLVVNQVLETYVAKEENMVKYLEKAKSLISGFDNFSINQVLSSKNKKVQGQVFDSRYELFHKLDRSESRGNNHRRSVIREAKTKVKMTKYYNTRVRGVTFRPGDFVYRSNEASHAMDGGKLGP